MVRSLRVHGKGTDKYDNIRIGLNSRLDSIQAAILIEKLAAFPNELKLRQNIAMSYTNSLKEKYHCPILPHGYTSSWAQYSVRLKNGPRENIMTILKDNKIPSVIYYEKNMHQQTAFKGLGKRIENLRVAERMAKNVFSLPMHPYLSEAETARIVEVLLHE